MRQRWVILAATLCAGCWSAVSALGMGDIDVNSRLNQPFSASIPLTSLSADEAEGLQVRVAPSREFERAGVERKDYLSSLKFEIVGDKAPYIRITSNQVAKEPFLNLLIEARSGGARVVREYTVLLDPPGMASARPAAPAAAASVATAPEAERASTALPSAPTPATNGDAAQGAARTYGPVRDAETFWSIATALRPGPAVSMDQTLLALYEANRGAFLGFNGLMRGVTLRVPSAQEMLEVSPAEAKARVDALRAGRRLPPRTAVAPSAAKGPAVAKAKPGPAVAAGKPAPAAQSPGAPASNPSDRSAAAEPAGKAKPAPQAPAAVAASPAVPAKSVAPAAPVAQSAVEPATPAASSAASSSATPSATSSAPESVATPLAASGTAAATPEAGSTTAESATPLTASGASAPLARESELAPADEAPAAPLQRERAPPPSQAFWAGWLNDALNFWVLLILVLIGLLLLLLLFRRRKDDDYAVPRRPVQGVPPAAVAAASGSAVVAAPLAVAAATTEPVEDAAAGAPAPEADVAVAAEVLSDEPPAAAPHTPPTAEPTTVPESPLEPSLAVAAAYGLSQERAQSQDLAGNSGNSGEADLHMAYGLHDEAIASLKAALAEDPYRRDLRIKLAETYFAAGKPQEFHETAEWLQPRLGAAEWAHIAALGRQLSPEAAPYQDAQRIELAGFDAPAAETQPVLSSAPQGNYSEPLELGYGTQPLPADDPFESAPPFQPAESFEPAPEFQAEPSFETATSEPAPECIELEPPVESHYEPASHVEPQSPFDAAPAFEPALLVEPEPTPQPASQPEPVEVLEFTAEDLQLSPAPVAEPEPQPQPHGNTVDFNLSEFDLSLEPPATSPSLPPAHGNSINFDLSQFDQPATPPDLNDFSGFEMRPEDYELELPEGEFASDDEAGTKLDLARAYLDMGDNEMARSLLDEVSSQGTYQQKADAQALLQRLPPL